MTEQEQSVLTEEERDLVKRHRQWAEAHRHASDGYKILAIIDRLAGEVETSQADRDRYKRERDEAIKRAEQAEADCAQHRLDLESIRFVLGGRSGENIPDDLGACRSNTARVLEVLKDMLQADHPGSAILKERDELQKTLHAIDELMTKHGAGLDASGNPSAPTFHRVASLISQWQHRWNAAKERDDLRRQVNGLSAIADRAIDLLRKSNIPPEWRTPIEDDLRRTRPTPAPSAEGEVCFKCGERKEELTMLYRIGSSGEETDWICFQCLVLAAQQRGGE